MKQLLLITICALSVGTLSAERSDVPSFFFGPNTAKTLPSSVCSQFSIVESEGIDFQKLKGLFVDLNGDGKQELILMLDLCGTGGCPFQIYDGATHKKIGELFGSSVWIFQHRLNHWPVLQTYSHSSGSSGAFECLVFDRREYVVVSHVDLYDKSVDQLFERYKGARKIE